MRDEKMTSQVEKTMKLIKRNGAEVIFDREKICDKEDFFVQAYYVIKKH